MAKQEARKLKRYRAFSTGGSVEGIVVVVTLKDVRLLLEEEFAIESELLPEPLTGWKLVLLLLFE